MSVPEGGTATYTVVLTAQPIDTDDFDDDVKIVVDLLDGGDPDLTLSPPELDFTSLNWNVPQTVTVTAADDEDEVHGTATIEHAVTGETPFSGITIPLVQVTERDDEAPVTTVPTEPVEITITLTSTALGERGDVVEGESYQITATANFSDHVDTEVTIMRDHGQSDATDDDFTVGPITIAAGKITGTTALMVTADEVAEKGEKLVLYGIANNARTNNALMFTIWDSAVPALPLIGQLLLALFLMARGARLHRRWRD